MPERPASEGTGPVRLGTGDVLLIVDVQNDFMPGGALGVRAGDQVVPVLNRYIRHFLRQGLPVVFTRDWHPPRHCSFQAQGGPWPPHCIAGSEGAEFAPGLELPAGALVISKATAPREEAYSAFQGTELEARLRSHGHHRLFVGGLATDYCVLATVRDARAAGFSVFVLGDACRPVDAQPGDGLRAEMEMANLGAVSVTFASLGGENHEQ